MKEIIRNIKLVIKNKKYLLIFIVTTLLFLYVGYITFNYENSLGNLWKTITYWEITLHILLSILFGIFLSGQIYKIYAMWTIKTEGKSKGILWWIFGVLITGCPSCSIGIASYLGLSSILSFLPRYGLELKIAAVVLLLWANYSLYKNLLVCKRKTLIN